MKTLVVIAESEEISLVKRLGYDKFPILVTGVGVLNVIEALKDIPKDTEIVNIGYAGSKNLEPKFYAVKSVTLHHPNVSYNEKVYTLGYTSSTCAEELDEDDSDLYTGKMCYTSADFVTESDKENCLFDMELGYIMALGFKNVTAFKYVSDNLDIQEYRKKLKDEK